MTNVEYLKSLTEEQKKEVEKTYANHPLAKFIDWEAFLSSENGNEMDFVISIGTTMYENKEVTVLEETIENDISYARVWDGECVCLVPIAE